MVSSPSVGLGIKLALGVGAACFAGAVAVLLFGGERIFAVLLVVVGASALAGWHKSRRRSDP